MKKKPKIEAGPLTKAQCRETLLAYLVSLVAYWETESRAESLKEKMQGLVFSILSMLDGEDGTMPAFRLSPSPHPEDKRYRQKHGASWWPSGLNLSGDLHHDFSKYAQMDTKELRRALGRASFYVGCSNCFVDAQGRVVVVSMCDNGQTYKSVDAGEKWRKVKPRKFQTPS
jgi:hypothetical protein